MTNIDNSLSISIAVVGTGYVGLVTGVCFSELGFNVICLDKDLAKIDSIKQGNIPIYEPTLTELLQNNMKNGRLHFDTDLPSALSGCDIIFIAVGTPTHPQTGEADLRYVTEVAQELAPWLNQPKTIVVKSTVPVGTGQRIKHIILNKNPKAKFTMVSNPEFLREGSAVFDFMNPDRIIVGSECLKARQLMDRLYQPFAKRGVPIVHSNIETAEMIKYAANCFLASKIAFVNEIAALCEILNADVENVMLGMGLDKRIGSGYLKPGPGYGGSCFPKDTLALHYAAAQVKAPLKIIEAVIQSNEQRKTAMIHKIISACGGSVAGKTLAILGVAFKANTDDVRDSAALTIIRGLHAQGAKLKIFDPEAMEKAAEVLHDLGMDGVKGLNTEGLNDLPVAGIKDLQAEGSKDRQLIWAKDIDNAILDAEAVVIVTEWTEFANLDLNRLKKLMKPLITSNSLDNIPLLIDLRNLYSPQTVTEAGLKYVSIGRPPAMPVQEEVLEKIL